MWHILKHIPYAKIRLKSKIAAMIKALKIKRSSIYFMLDFKVLIQIRAVCPSVSVSRIGCTYPSPILEMERREREMRVNSVMLRGGEAWVKIFGQKTLEYNPLTSSSPSINCQLLRQCYNVRKSMADFPQSMG